MAVKWSGVIASQKTWLEQVCRYLDEWSPPPAGMSAHRAAAFATVRERLLDYSRDNGASRRILSASDSTFAR